MLGYNAGHSNTHGNANTFVGVNAGATSIISGGNNLILGDNIDPGADVSGAILIGCSAVNQLDFNLSNANVWTAKKAIILPADPTVALSAATKQYVDAHGARVLPGYLSSLTLFNDATSPNSVIDVAAGAATSDDNSTTMVLSSPFTKSMGGPWTAGSGGLGFDTGTFTTANTWYHIFLIMRTDTGVVDLLISTSATAPTMPANYTKKRRLGSIRTNASSQITAFTQSGDNFLWNLPTNDASNIAITASFQTVVLRVPTGISVRAYFTAIAVSGTAGTQVALANSALSLGTPTTGGNTQLVVPGAGQFQIDTDSAGHISYGANGTGSTLYIWTYGWTDNRGK
jgi:hypothetical protein